MSYRLTDRSAFKAANLENWRTNSAFWLEGRMRHLEDVGDFVRDRILELLGQREDGLVLDMGCGDAWVLRRLRERADPIRYCGLDFNEAFITANQERYRSDADASFAVADFELPIPEDLTGCAEVVVNCFNFFELPGLREGFEFAAGALSPGGCLLIVTIDPIMQMLSITTTREQLDELLHVYERDRDLLAYDKEIDVGGEHTGRVYKGLMYSAADFAGAANAVGLSLVGYREVVRTSRRPPQIYQILEFRKGQPDESPI